MIFDMCDQGGGHGNSALHRVSAGFKLLVLALISVVLFTWPILWLIGLIFLGVVSLYPLAGFSLFTPLRQFKNLFWLIGILFVFSLLNVGWLSASILVLRLVCLFFLANLVTLTTPMSVMMASFERFFTILKPFGLHPARVALVFSLTLRFIPVLSRSMAEIRQAQAARGLERSFVASFIPMIVSMLKMSEEIADAIEARAFDE